jgi:DNA ligase-1
MGGIGCWTVPTAGVPRFPSSVGVRIDQRFPASASVRRVEGVTCRAASAELKAKPVAEVKATPAAAGARYFEFVEGASSKFWELRLEGRSFTTRYEKIGTDGRVTKKDYDNGAKAAAEADRLISEKTKKGYVEKRR